MNLLADRHIWVHTHFLASLERLKDIERHFLGLLSVTTCFFSAIIGGTVFFKNMFDTLFECLDKCLSVTFEDHVAQSDFRGSRKGLQGRALGVKVGLLGYVAPYR